MTEYVLDGRYAFIERIATGGMGEVWRGADQVLGRPVAIKLLSTAHAGDEQFRARFRAEARYAAALSHPGIARVFDYGESSPLGGPYLVMELVKGEPLSAILERAGKLSPDITLDIVGQAARALDAAHQAGIVHRDIKPGNLLIMADGTTKITDFGIAKARAEQALNLTATGIVMGTALYVSPEQATGATLTGASDIYSLGVVAYECLAGQPPFVADQPLAIAIMHKHDPVPPLPADVPRPVGDLVLAMLAKTPEGRPESARHVADRADVIREALSRSGAGGPGTPDVPAAFAHSPTVGAFPGGPKRAAGPRFDDSERAARSRSDGSERAAGSRPSTRRLAAAGVGVAVCGVGAIVAVLLTAGAHPAAPAGLTQSPSQSGSHARSGASASMNPAAVGSVTPGTNLNPASTTTTTHSARPTSGHQSPKPGQSGSASSPASTGTGSGSSPTTHPPTSPTTHPPTSPTSTPPTSPTSTPPTSPTSTPPTSPTSTPPTSPTSTPPSTGNDASRGMTVAMQGGLEKRRP